MTWVKICGLRRQEDAELAAELGADALGFVFEPSSPRWVGSLDWSPEWLRLLKPEKVAVFGPLPRAVSLSAQFGTIQAIGAKAAEYGGRQIQAVLRVGPNALAEVQALAEFADRIVLDAPAAGQYGGTGHRVDWAMAREIVRASPVPVVLAGGLTPENVGEAMATVQPFGVDVSSGIESSPGIKDPGKLRAFLLAARGHHSPP